MRRVLVGLLAVLSLAHAADVTGTWSGTLAMTNGGETRDDTAMLILKQTGNTVTGTVGPNAERRMDITKGTADGDNIRIEAMVQGDNKIILELKVSGDKLTGDMKAEGPTAPPVTGKMTLSKEK